ncbi:hypothetical protein PORY_001801 [Pneumocystis oryctolagi]|uniref:Uncharacterized protein n=2 Tax=Pneumocystis oryctolagi TaxID=42067 RepID=A0ACB7CCT8_9ASCO|nr:hypothetical protein PORY_001789 [Pneumocystis oryctolagi]KAG4304748.1 hypothetical protein PORY_001801 [Pneumocystis oryctolagi]
MKKDTEDLNRSFFITKQKLEYELLKTTTTKIYMQEENRRARLEIAILNNEKNELFESELKYKQTIEKLVNELQTLQNNFFLEKQKNEELNSKISEYQEKLSNFQKNTSEINSIISQNTTLIQKIKFLETELKNKSLFLQNNIEKEQTLTCDKETSEVYDLKKEKKNSNQVIQTINKKNDLSNDRTSKKDKLKQFKKNKTQVLEIKNNSTDARILTKHSEELHEKTKKINSKHYKSKDAYIYNTDPHVISLETKDESKSNPVLSTFSITPLLDRTNINIKNPFFSPLQSNKSIKSGSILKNKFKTKEHNISKKKRKLGAIGKTLFDETPKELTKMKFLQNINEKYKIFKPGNTVVDLGFSPGSWTQVAVEKVGPKGRVLGVDILPSQPPVGASSMQGNFLSKATQEAIIRYLSDPNRGRQSSISFNSEDGEKLSYIDLERRMEQNDSEDFNREVADVILSDMLAPLPQIDGFYKRSLSDPYHRLANVSGISVKDHGASMDLCDSALLFCIDALRVGGNFICKFYSGIEDKILFKKMQKVFQKVKREKPDASRNESREAYFIGLKKRALISKKDIENI